MWGEAQGKGMGGGVKNKGRGKEKCVGVWGR